MENADTPPTTTPKADWERVERDYRAGVLSIREVARLNGLSDKAVRNKAKALGWERDLSAKVAEQVRRELLRTESAEEKARTERQIVAEAAAPVVQVVREHRVRIKQGSALVELLTKQLLDVAGKRDEFEAAIEAECAEDQKPERYRRLMAAVSLEKHAQIAGSLATATKIWVGLERQAFGLTGDESPAQPPDPAQSKNVGREIANEMADILRERAGERLAQPK